MNENPLQGSFIVEELTDLVEEAVLAEFDRITERGGVLGAMETGYQRGRIQDESMLYEQRKHDGSLPIIGVNTFRKPARATRRRREVELARATEAEKQSPAAPRPRLPGTARRRGAGGAGAAQGVGDRRASNVFAVLMDAARVVLARPDHRGLLRGRRAVPPQRVVHRSLTRQGWVTAGRTGDMLGRVPAHAGARVREETDPGDRHTRPRDPGQGPPRSTR